MRGRKPLPSALHEASGAYAKNPQRRNREEPKPTAGIPEKPDIVANDQVASACWDRVCKKLIDMGTMTIADEDLLTIYCLDWSQLVWLQEVLREGNVTEVNGNGNRVSSPEAANYHKYAARIQKAQVELGLTPSSRSRIRAPQAEENDPFQEWLKEAMSSDN
jgi:P27 family predicted phage terminase small subunit